MTPAEFLDVVHHYLLLISDPKKHEAMNRDLIGPPRIERPTLVDDVAGFVPPAWWRGDEYAANSGRVAAVTLRRRV